MLAIMGLLGFAVAVVVGLLLALWSITHGITYTWKNGNNNLSAAPSQTATSGREPNFSLALTANQANVEVDVVFTNATLHDIFILPAQDCTMYVNDVSGGSPTDTIALKANVPFVWMKASGLAFPFTGTGGTHAVSKFYFTNGAVAQTVEGRLLVDTP